MRQPHGCSIRKDGRLELRFSVLNNRYSVYGRTYQECLAKKEKKLIEVYSGNSNIRSLIPPGVSGFKAFRTVRNVDDEQKRNNSGFNDLYKLSEMEKYF